MSTLSALLEADEEPSPQSYRNSAHGMISYTQSIGTLVHGRIQVLLATRSRRFRRLFDEIYICLPETKSAKTREVAASTASVLIQLLPELESLLAAGDLTDTLVPVLQVCLAPFQPTGLSQLARILCETGNLLERLASHPSGSGAIRRWCAFPKSLALDETTRHTWTERLVKMVKLCWGDHGINPTLLRWEKLAATRQALLQLQSEMLGRSPNKQPNSVQRMEDLGDLLSTFDLQIPGSLRIIEGNLHHLLDEPTISILQSVVSTFPCKLCVEDLGPRPQGVDSDRETTLDQELSELPLDVLGKDLGIWRLLLSEQALSAVQALSQKGTLDPLRKELIRLCSGHFPPLGEPAKNLKIPLNYINCGQETFILWQISIGSAGNKQALQQILVVWEIADAKAVSEASSRVALIQQSYSLEKVRCCRTTPNIIDGVRVPVQFGDHMLEHIQPEDSPTGLDVRSVDEQTIRMAHKFYALTEPVMNSILMKDLAAEFPLDISKKEVQCITHVKSSSLIIGRSGTGKTTCLVFKLVGKYIASRGTSSERPLRQVLLTRSEFLVEKLRAYTGRLIRTLSSPELLTVEDLKKQERERAGKDRERQNLLGIDDESFPLVCTFDRFLRLLENTAFAMDRQNMDQPSYGRPLIDYRAFCLEFWPHLDHHLTKGLSSHLVFAEIMGVIKGSQSSLQSLSPLTREDYLQRSSRIAPNFTLEDDRSRVYNIFERYEEHKRDTGSFDNVDRVIKILRAVRMNLFLRRLLQQTLDECYVDEVQDHNCLDFELLFSIVTNPRGFHFAGDTAQAISQDSTFRFADVKSIMFDHYAVAESVNSQKHSSLPAMFGLSQNYRSHQGILNVASMIIDLLWKAFPGTIDKLSPETGILTGPKALLFIGCGSEVLRSGTTGSAKLAERSRDFGAEQVILVRDADAKSKLEAVMGDMALIFTILESKGMEFDDVILFNFFSGCIDQQGLRSLANLKDRSRDFDSRKHSGMCSELKHLYVATTRARAQLFLIETSEVASKEIESLFSNDELGKLLEVTKPGDKDFDLRVQGLRPNTSVSPADWARRAQDLMRIRMYEKAIMAYQKAGIPEGEKKARAHWIEEQAKLAKAKGDKDCYTHQIEAAHQLFVEIGYVDEALRILESLEQWERAARLCKAQKSFSDAARFFSQGGLYVEAAYSHSAAGEHEEAVALLRKGERYDNLVSYLHRNGDKLSPKTLRNSIFFCKLLLKQKKLLPESRGAAIKLLGTPEEQEMCFLEYAINDEVETLYKQNQRYNDLYHLYFRCGRLEDALELVLTKDLMRTGTSVKEDTVSRILDYLLTAQLITGKRVPLLSNHKLLQERLPSVMIAKLKDWKAVCTMDGIGISKLDNSIAKNVSCLFRTVNHQSLAKICELGSLPGWAVEGAARIVECEANNPEVTSIYALVCGVWRSSGIDAQPSYLAWSPFRGKSVNSSETSINTTSRQWVLNAFAKFVLAFDSKARKLMNERWPAHCAKFSMRGFYSHKCHSQCPRRHADITENEYTEFLQNLLRMTNIFCKLSSLYSSRIIAATEFQQRFLGIRRYWLETTVRMVTFLSCVEQSSSAISAALARVISSSDFLAVRSYLEELLFYRLRTEWTERHSFTALLEQMQLALTLGLHIHSRFWRAIRSRLLVEKGQLERTLRDLARPRLTRNEEARKELARGEFLKRNLTYRLMEHPFPTRSPVMALKSASTFQQQMRNFLQSLRNIDIDELSILHSLTGLFEYWATFLILKTCTSASLLTQSWIRMHATRVARLIYPAASDPQAQQADESSSYLQCLVQLVSSFGETLDRLSKAPRYLCNGSTHFPALLKQRNLELLAIMLCNLGARPLLPAGFNELWHSAKGFFGRYDPVGTRYSMSDSPDALAQKLSDSFRHYSGKDKLIVVLRDKQPPRHFGSLIKQNKVDTILLDELCPRSSAASTQNDFQEIADSQTEKEQEFSQAHIEAAKEIWRFWKSFAPRVQWRKHPEAQTAQRFINLAARAPTESQFKIRLILIADAFLLSFQLLAAKEDLQKLNSNTSQCLAEVEVHDDVDETLDGILHQKSEVQALLAEATELLSDPSLLPLMEDGRTDALKQAIQRGKDLIEMANHRMKDARKVIDSILKRSA
ncbi:hypothetical protein ACLMJK_002858 [Lecanora helva]